MNRTRVLAVIALTVLVPAAQTIRADVKADQKNKIEFGGMLGSMYNMFGGGGAKDGVASSVAVKGSRKATLNDVTGQIIDLSEEKVYDLDMRKKTYKVTTFEELRRRIEEARKKAEADAAKQQPSGNEPAAQDPNAKQMEVDFSIKNTGEKKAINGFDTHETIVTITVREKGKTLEQSGGLVMKSDLWLAPKIAAMKEVGEFDAKYAQKVYGSMMPGVSAAQMASVMAMYPMMKDALAKMNAENDKIEGTPIQTVTTMEAVPSPEQKADAQSSGSQGKPQGLGGMLGGMMAKKMGGAQKKDDSGAPAPFMTNTTEVLKVTTDVGAADVAIPAGFKENK